FLVDNVLGGLLGEIPIDLSPVLDALVGQLVTNTVLIPVLQLLGITDAQGVTDLLRLLNLVGLDLSDPLNLGNLGVPGLNVVTAGPVFTMLKLLGADLGWVPPLPNSVAGDINGTEYLEVGAVGLLTTLLDRLTRTLPGNP
ncbi:AAA family ATPase, partial [Mycolicibacterium elephantis]